MTEYLDNPRRVPRDAVHLRASVLFGTGAAETTTEDIGSRGCQVILPTQLQRGASVALTLEAPHSAAPLRIEGRVVWVSPQPPWRVGIAYSGNGLNLAARWMEAFRQSSPELFRRERPIVERVAVDAMVFLGLAPKLPDFTDDELTVLRAVGSGVRVAELRTVLSRSRTWPRMQRSFFALLNRGYLTLSRAASAHPVTWKAILGAPPATLAPGVTVVGEELVLESLLERASPTPPPQAAAPATARTPPPAPRRAAPATPGPPPLPAQPRTTAPATAPPPLPLSAASPRAPTSPAVAAPSPIPPAPEPRRDFAGAGVGWRHGAVRPRSAEADALYQLGIAELEGKRTQQALSVLRRALALAPGDPEIAHAIGRAMKG